MARPTTSLAGEPSPNDARKEHRHGALSGSILQFLGMMMLWLVLSGRFEAKYVIFGVLSVGVFTLVNRDLLHFPGHPANAWRTDVRLRLTSSWRFLCYLPWLIYSIVVANLQILWVVVHPKLPIEPMLLQFRTQFQSAIAQVILANSITLTPGTITVDLVDGVYTVHAMMPASAESLLTAEMQNRIASVFGEEEEKDPEARWLTQMEGKA